MLKAKPFANALTVVMGIFYVVCALWVAVTPGFFRGIAQTWFHGYDLSVIPTAPITFGNFLVGLITAVVITWLFGYLFVWVYNKLNKKI